MSDPRRGRVTQPAAIGAGVELAFREYSAVVDNRFDAMSKRIADMYVSGVDRRGLTVATNGDAQHVAGIRRAVTTVAAGGDGRRLAAKP